MMGPLYKEFPKTMSAGDFWRQIKRTVNGEPVSEEQIAMIVTAIEQSLQLKPEDQLLDLACGNGALSRYFFDQCSGFLGVDLSEVLIDVARRYFGQDGREFLLADVGDYILAEKHPKRFTKVLCYGSFSYFPEQTARAVLTRLHRDFVRVEKIFLGNLPDLALQHLFYNDGLDHSAELKNADSLIGVWRSEDEMRQLAQDCGWHAAISRMPPAFYASHYRYDVLLTRGPQGDAD